MKQTSRILLMLLTLVSMSATTVPALELVSEVRVESTTGAPVKDGLTFSGLGFSDFVLKVFNGDVDSNRISSAVISLNGVKILSPADFNQTVTSLERSIVPLQGDNILSVSLRSNPGGFLKIQIFGEPTLNLPPDPGPAGDETIEGIDVNANGVRDDVERWIGLNYRDSEKTREALTQAYYPLQNFMIHARQGDRDAVYNDMTALQRANECLKYIRPDDAYSIGIDLQAQIINTSERIYAYRESSQMLGGGSFPRVPRSKWKGSCTFDLNNLRN
jgi:hypothetical protein